MKIKIQRTEEAITFKKMWPDKETKRELMKDLTDVHQDFFDLAKRFFECFPKFREVIFNTELTDNK